jgi:hypothetical protein
MNAKQILEDLHKIYPQTNLHLDPLFEANLQEELDVFWKTSTLDEAILSFDLAENGELIYHGISQKIDESVVLAFKILSPKIVSNESRANVTTFNFLSRLVGIQEKQLKEFQQEKAKRAKLQEKQEKVLNYLLKKDKI